MRTNDDSDSGRKPTSTNPISRTSSPNPSDNDDDAASESSASPVVSPSARRTSSSTGTNRRETGAADFPSDSMMNFVSSSLPKGSSSSASFAGSSSLQSPGQSSGMATLGQAATVPSEAQLMRQAHFLGQRQQQLENMLATAATSPMAMRNTMVSPAATAAMLQQQQQQQQQALLDRQLLLQQQQQNMLLQQQQQQQQLPFASAAGPQLGAVGLVGPSLGLGGTQLGGVAGGLGAVGPTPLMPPLSSYLLSDPAIQQSQQAAAAAAGGVTAASLPSDILRQGDSQPSDEAFRRGNGVSLRSTEPKRQQHQDDSEGDDDDDTAVVTSGPGNTIKLGSSSSAGGSNNETFEAFPQKLHRMILEAEENKQDDIISFFPHGRAFVIHKPRLFVSEIMPKYFTTTRMSSFQRQLNLYGFKRITEGQDMGGYGHRHFIKGRPDLIAKIKRKQYSKNTRLVRPREPNFYTMPPMLQGASVGATTNLLQPPGGGMGAAAGVAGMGTAAAGFPTGGSVGMMAPPYASNDLLMMQNGANLMSLQHEAAMLQQEKANMMALMRQQQQQQQQLLMQQQQQQQQQEERDQEE